MAAPNQKVGNSRYIITNAHSVFHAAVVEVRKRGEAVKFVAKVLCVH